MDQVTIAQTKNQIRKLEERLANGWDWLADPANTTHPKYRDHEDLWLGLLAEYEQASDTLRCHQPAMKQEALA